MRKPQSPGLGLVLLSAGMTSAVTWLTIRLLHWPWWFGYLLGINLATFIVYGFDKAIAGGQHGRVPENMLHGLALLGGTPGAWAAQRVWHHKTIKRSFRTRFWTIAVLQLLCIAGYLGYHIFYGFRS